MKIIVHKFNVGDVEDPVLYAGAPLYEWEHSDIGQWVLEHSAESPTWTQYVDPVNYGYQFVVTADLSEEDVTYFALKWGMIK